jgi:hypothetical protein
MSGTNTTKESNSHTSRETESSHQARPQRNSSGTKSRRVAAPKKSSSVAKAPVTSAAATERTRRPIDIGNMQPNSLHARLARQKELQDALNAKAAQDAAEKKAKAEAEWLEAAKERKERIAFLRKKGKNTSYDTTWVIEEDSESDGAAIQPPRNSAAKKATAKEQQPKKTNGKKRVKNPKASSTSPPVSTSLKKVKSTTAEQLDLPNAESDSASTETLSASHNTSSSPVPASAPHDAVDHDVNLEYAMREEIYSGFEQLSPSQTIDVMNIIMQYANQGNSQMELDDDNTLGVDDIPSRDLVIVVNRIRAHLSHNAIKGKDKDNTNGVSDGTKKKGKRSLDDDDDDDQVTSEDPDVHRSKKARISEPDGSPREKSAHAASREGSFDESALPNSTQNSVTVYSAAVNGGVVPAVTGGMIPFGAVGHAAQKYHDLQEQRFKVQIAPFKKQEPAKQLQKRSASEAQLDEPISKRVKQFDEGMALQNEAQQATEEPVAEAKSFKQEDIMEKPEVAFSADTDDATPDYHNNQTTSGEDANATETEPTTKEEADSTNDEENKSPSSSGDSDGEKKAAEKTSTTGSATTETLSPTDHQDATKIINKTSQTSDEESAESHSNETAATTMKQEEASHGGEAESTTETQDGQKGAKATATDAPASTTTSGSATTTDTQQEPALKSKKNSAQDRVAKASKKSAKDSDSDDTDDESGSDIELPVNRKPASRSERKPQNSAKANNDQHTNANKQGAARRKRAPVNPASSAQDNKKSTSKASAVNQPSAPKPQSGPPAPASRFIPSSTAYNERQAALSNPSQASTNGPKAAKRPLADKTNTHRQPTKSDPKKTPAASKNKQQETAIEQPTQVKPAASKKRKQDDADATKSTEAPMRKKQRGEPSKKRRRDDDEDDDEDDDTASTKKPAKKPVKKQRTNPSSTSTSNQPDPDVSEALRPIRASRSRAAAAPTQVQRAPNPELWVNFDEVPPKPQDQAQTHAPDPVKEDEKAEENEQKDEQTNSDDVEHGVKDDSTPGDVGNAQDAPKKKGDGIARRKGTELQKKEKKKSGPRQMSENAKMKKAVGGFVMGGRRG